jgi:signal transduction histidine kinase/CheY-like chemotaxis protein
MEEGISEDPSNAARRQIDFRMSIVESRVNVLTEGQFAVWATSNSEANETLSRIRQSIAELRAVLSSSDFLGRLSSVINVAQAEARKLTMFALRHERRERETVFSELEAQHSFGVFMGYAAVLTFLVAVIVILIQWRRRDRYEYELIVIDEKLNQTVLNYEYFIRVTSHELRNSAQVINAMLDRDLTLNDRRISSSTAESLQSFNENVLSLLDFARILSGNADYKISETDVKSTLEAWAGAAFLGSVIDYELNIDEGLPRIYIQQTVFFRAMSNVMLNAERHARSRVVIDVNLDGTKRKVEIDVHDDGGGFTREALDAFSAGLSNLGAETETGGMGIGLMVSRQILDGVGGTIEVIGSKYGGASVRVTIPFDVSRSEDVAQDFVLPIGQKRYPSRGKFPPLSKRILYCEDNPDVFEATFSLLEEHYDFVKGARTVEECVACLKADKFNVVLIDYNLGGRSAEEVIRTIMEDSIETKIILVTGMNKDRIKHITWADEILFKPVKFNVIKSSLDEVFRAMSAENREKPPAFARECN